MDKNDIRIKASHKIKNNHYFERYLKLMELFSIKNKSLQNGAYVESHHILPKATDMFPEYKCFNNHPWNKIDLTPRQHFIAHWILWKAFSGSQAYAFKCFITQIECKNNQRQDFKITSRVYEEITIQSSSYIRECMRGKAYYLDNSGNTVHCRTDDPRVISGELVSTSKGRTYKPRTEEQKLKTKRSLLQHHRNKKDQPKVSFYRGIEKVSVTKYSDDYHYYISNNEWSTKCTPERFSFTTAEYNKNRERPSWSEESRKKVSTRFKGKKQPKKQVINATLGRRNRRGWEVGDYDIFVYDKNKDLFLMIDQMFFDENRYMKVSKHIKGISKKIINAKTKKILCCNPDLPRLPKDFMFLDDYRQLNTYVTVLNVDNMNFSKIKRLDIGENHIEIVARNDDRVKITDNEGKKRYVPKEIKELYFT